MALTLKRIWDQPHDEIQAVLVQGGYQPSDNENYNRAALAILYRDKKVPFNASDSHSLNRPDFLKVMSETKTLSEGLDKLENAFYEQLGLLYGIYETVCAVTTGLILVANYKVSVDNLDRDIGATSLKLSVARAANEAAHIATNKALVEVTVATLNPIYDVWGRNLALNVAEQHYQQAYAHSNEVEKIYHDLFKVSTQLDIKKVLMPPWQTIRLRLSPGDSLTTTFIANAKKRSGCQAMGPLMASISSQGYLTRINNESTPYDIDTIVNNIIMKAPITAEILVEREVWRALLSEPLVRLYDIKAKSIDKGYVIRSLLKIDYSEMLPVVRCFYLYQLQVLMSILPPISEQTKQYEKLRRQYGCFSMYVPPEFIIEGLNPLIGQIGEVGGAKAMSELIIALTGQELTEADVREQLLAML